MTPEGLKKFQEACRELRFITGDLAELSVILSSVGLDKVARRASEACKGVRLAERQIDGAIADTLAAYVNGSEQATVNMVNAALAGVQIASGGGDPRMDAEIDAGMC